MNNLDEIKEHFNKLNEEEFMALLVECGLGKIKSSTDFGYRLLSPEECEKFLKATRN